MSRAACSSRSAQSSASSGGFAMLLTCAYACVSAPTCGFCCGLGIPTGAPPMTDAPALSRRRFFGGFRFGSGNAVSGAWAEAACSRRGFRGAERAVASWVGSFEAWVLNMPSWTGPSCGLAPGGTLLLPDARRHSEPSPHCSCRTRPVSRAALKEKGTSRTMKAKRDAR